MTRKPKRKDERMDGYGWWEGSANGKKIELTKDTKENSVYIQNEE